MANFGGRLRINFARGSAIVAGLGIVLLQLGIPSLTSLSAMAEAGIQASAETIAARRWQDPFAAIEKSFDKSGRGNLEPECSKTVNGASARQSPLAERERGTLVIGVMVPGEPYSQDAEHRKRTRFAVLAGLARTGFEPQNLSQISYFLWPYPASDERPSAGPVQARSTVPALMLHDQETQAWEKAAATAEPQETAIAYEWFEEVSQRFQADKKHILVLWLNEEAFRGEPLRKLSGLKRFLYADSSTNGSDSSFKLIGPYSSNMLREMVDETRKFAYAPPYDQAFGQLSGQANSPDLNDVQFYAYGATAADNQLLGDLSGNYGTVQRLFEALGLHLQRTIATDRALARGLVSELKRRKVGVGFAGADVALISEWDGYYSQSLPKAVELALGHTRPGGRMNPRDGYNPGWIHNLPYLRGLDGQALQAGNLEEVTGSNERARGTKQIGAQNSFDRPMGQSQADYLRRLSEELHEVDNDLRRGKRGIKAIGVLGSNVFDKLLILRALRPQFPEALFFTTDFDEAFTMGSELPWTRNLIVSSSFGPTLHKRIQRETPAFRGSYQTSAFLATLLAIGDPAKHWITQPAVSDYISGQLLVSRIFEIGRSGNVLSLAGDRLPLQVAPPGIPGWKHEGCPGNSENCSAAQLLATTGSVMEGRSAAEFWPQGFADWDCRNEDATNCGDIQPRTGKLFPRFERSSQLTLGLSLAGGALFVLVTLYLRVLPRAMSVEAWLISLGLAAGASACAFWEPLAQFLTEHGNGEPIALFQGVSVWPTVLLRGLGIVMAIYLIWRAQRCLRNNLAGIAGQLRLDMSPRGSRDLRSLVNNIFAPFGHFRGNDRAAKPTPIEVEALWRSYVGQEALWPRFCRAFSYTAAAYLIVSLFAVPLFGNPSVPVRGALAASAYCWSTFLYDLLMLFLTCFVFDATFCCLRFVGRLCRAQCAWPEETSRLFNDRLPPQGDTVRDWFNLEFVASRARCIGSLIYYPVGLIALFMVTSSTAYANYPQNFSRFAAAGISLVALLACAAALCIAADRVRAAVQKNLLRVMVSSKGHGVRSKRRGKSASAKSASDDRDYAEQFEFLLSQARRKGEGTFGLLARQLLIWVVFMLAGGFGWTILFENGLLPGL